MQIGSAAPVWAKEPAKAVGWALTAVIVAAGIVVEVLNSVVDVFPAEWQGRITAATAAVVFVGTITTRIQAVVTRNGFGRPGRFFDGVYSPHTVQEAMRPSPEEIGPGGVGPAAIVPPEV